MRLSFNQRILVVVSLSLACASTLAAQTDLPPVAKQGERGYVSGKLIYELEGRPTPQCHASTIVESPAGLVAAWFGGKHENNPDVGIWVSRHDGQKWSKPVEVINGSEGEEQDFACWNPVLFQPKDAPLMLFYKVGKSPRLWWGMLITSEDGGKTWSKPRRLGKSQSLPDANQNLLGPVKNKPIQFADGSILCPTSTENGGWRVHFELTGDLGKTWEVIGPINDASKFNAIQPTILTYADGRLQVLCRSRENVIAQSWSHDGGKTWSPVTATDLPNPNAGLDAVTLKDGRQLLVYNHSIRKDGLNGRQILNVAISDDGKKWTPALTLENEGNKAGYSYPAVIQTKDGNVHITYTWRRQSIKHVLIDPDKVGQSVPD
jgi:predicted neuraminidase